MGQDYVVCAGCGVRLTMWTGTRCECGCAHVIAASQWRPMQLRLPLDKDEGMR